MTRTLIGLSGGLDSTYTLYKTLTETNDEVTALIISFNRTSYNKSILMDVESKEEYEGKIRNIKKIVGWLKANVRDFTLVEHEYDPDLLIRSQIDTPGVGPVVYIVMHAVEKINRNELDKIVLSNEKENDGFNYSRHGHTPGAKRALDFFKSKAKRGSITFPLIEMNYHQGNAISELPKELYAMTRSCSDADYDSEPCGICFKCSKRKFFAEMIDQGKSMEEIADYVYQKSMKPNGKWRSMKVWLFDEVSTYKRFNKNHTRPLLDYEVNPPVYPESYIA